jgi:hypothetical protein
MDLYFDAIAKVKDFILVAKLSNFVSSSIIYIFENWKMIFKIQLDLNLINLNLDKTVRSDLTVLSQ